MSIQNEVPFLAQRSAMAWQWSRQALKSWSSPNCVGLMEISMGPIVWTLISEIYPNRVRGRAISVATAVNWFAAFLVAQFFLSIVDAIGESTTFFIFSALCVVTYVFVWYFVPETKGRSLEEIQERWVKRGDRMLEENAA